MIFHQQDAFDDDDTDDEGAAAAPAKPAGGGYGSLFASLNAGPARTYKKYVPGQQAQASASWAWGSAASAQSGA